MRYVAAVVLPVAAMVLPVAFFGVPLSVAVSLGFIAFIATIALTRRPA